MRGQILGNIFICLAIILVNISPVLAEDVIEDPEIIPELPSIYISEVQTNGEGTGTSNQEFIELYNNSELTVDLIGYKIIYFTSSGTQSLLYEFVENLEFTPKSFVIGKLTTAPETFLADIEHHFEYEKGSSGMAATAGGLALLNKDDETIDEMSWTNSASSEEPRILNLSGGKSAQRYKLDDIFLESEDINERFIVDQPTPLELLTKVIPIIEEEPNIEEPIPEPLPVPKPEPTPVPNPKILINEIFPDPASPHLDSKDEFIELYNPNSVVVNLENYIVSAESTRKSSQELPAGAKISPKGYYYIKSSNSSVTLTNSGAKVGLVDNLGKQIDTVEYPDAISGAAWAKGSNGWGWTITPTPGKANVILAPVVKAKTSKSKSSNSSRTSTKKSSSTNKTNFTTAPPIKINEIFPDPKSPQKDSDDEFIELYNPHPFAINIADYTITSGATRTYKHVIKEGTIIAALGYFTVTSADTSLSLTNSGGKVTLINNFDKQIDMVEYSKAISGESWAFVGGKWQWTAKPTKNGANQLAKSSSNSATTNNENGTTQLAGAVVAGTDNTPLVPAPQPLPSWLLAVIGVAAVCYAAYEYRFEARNYYYKFRTIRSTR